MRDGSWYGTRGARGSHRGNVSAWKPVIEETIAEAREPLQINWYGDSYIEVPVRK
jgi:hypothetical protein